MMNERIKSLKQQAIDEVNDEVNLQHFTCPDNIQELIEQKFAELIVQECIDIVKEDKRISWDDSVNLIDSIKDNFGVK